MITVFIFETYFPFLIFVSIFSWSHTQKIFFRFSSPPFPLFTIKFTIFYFQSIHISKFNKFFIRVSLYQIRYIFFYHVMFYHDSYRYVSSSTIFNSVVRKGASWWSFGSWIYNYLCNQYLSPLTLRVRISPRRYNIVINLPVTCSGSVVFSVLSVLRAPPIKLTPTEICWKWC